MSHIRVTGTRGGYTVIPNSLLEPGVITARAYGLLCYLRSRPENWICTVYDLKHWFKEGRDAIYTALRELVHAGYMEMETYTEPGNTLMRKRYALDAEATHRRRSAPETASQDAGRPDTETAGVLITDEPTTEVKKTTTSAPPPISRGARDSRRPAANRPKNRADSRRPAKPRSTDTDADRNPTQALKLFDLPDNPAEAPPSAPRYRPDSGMGLAHHFEQRFREDTSLAAKVGTVNLAALAKHINTWTKAGVTPDQVRQMINLYAADPSLHLRGRAAWVSFVAQRHNLIARLADATERELWTNPDADGYHETWGTTAEDIAEYTEVKTLGQLRAEEATRA